MIISSGRLTVLRQPPQSNDPAGGELTSVSIHNQMTLMNWFIRLKNDSWISLEYSQVNEQVKPESDWLVSRVGGAYASLSVLRVTILSLVSRLWNLNVNARCVPGWMVGLMERLFFLRSCALNSYSPNARLILGLTHAHKQTSAFNLYEETGLLSDSKL